MSKKSKKQSYKIKVPVYTSAMIEKPADLFGGASYKNMTDYIIKKIDDYKQVHPVEKASFANRNKTRTTIINDIECHRHEHQDRDSLLLKISAYSTNFYDGYVEAETKIPFKKNHKVGSETNYVWVYPVINGVRRDQFIHYFVILIYEDPTKANDEIIKIAKASLKKILGIPVANIKLPTILEELRSYASIPELEMRYSAVHYHENEVDIDYLEYLVGGKFKKEKTDQFRNMPVDRLENLINDGREEEDYDRKVAKIKVGRKEYKITKSDLQETEEAVKETAEKVFNAETVISQIELDELVHDHEFIISKLSPILENYLSSNDDPGR